MDIESILIAAALGAWCDPNLGLELFRDLAHEDVARARRLIEDNKVSDENGIVADTAENIIRNLKRLNQSMQAAEDKIIQIMQEKIAPTASPGIEGCCTKSCRRFNLP
jgi:L-cysteine desulfidase